MKFLTVKLQDVYTPLPEDEVNETENSQTAEAASNDEIEAVSEETAEEVSEESEITEE